MKVIGLPSDPAVFSVKSYRVAESCYDAPVSVFDSAQRMNRAIDEVLKEPEVLKRFQVFGYATSGAGRLLLAEEMYGKA